VNKVFWFWFVTLSVPGWAAVSTANEYELKAAFLYNLGNFITWPPAVFKTSQDPFYICVMGENPFKEKLTVITAGQFILEHPLTTLHLQKIEETQPCQILFISDSEPLRLQSMLTWLHLKPILTVSDIQGFAQRGGMIEFFRYQDKIRLAVNPLAINQAKLKVNAHLLRISKIVYSQ